MSAYRSRAEVPRDEDELCDEDIRTPDMAGLSSSMAWLCRGDYDPEIPAPAPIVPDEFRPQSLGPHQRLRLLEIGGQSEDLADPEHGHPDDGLWAAYQRSMRAAHRRARAKSPARKVCPGCANDLPQSDFTRDSHRVDGLANRCRRCKRTERRHRDKVAARDARERDAA